MAKREPSPSITLNGSYGEGGGALLRTALTVSALTVQPVRVHHVRGAMRKPGISSEDLTFIQALEACTGATVEGGELGSQEIAFAPKHAPRPLRMALDIGGHEKGSVPGNALMVTQSLLPVLARAGGVSAFSVKGETYNPNTLTFDAFVGSTLALHRQQGLYVTAHQVSAGFGYAQHGEVHIEVEPSEIEGFEWSSRGSRKRVHMVLASNELHQDIVDRAVGRAERLMRDAGYEPDITHNSVNARMAGSHVTFLAAYERGLGTGTAMGAPGTRLDRVVEAAWDTMEGFIRSPGTLDPYLSDQALVLAAFANSPTHFITESVTPRLQTMAWVIRQFVPIAITILGRPGESGRVTVDPR